MVKKSKIPFRDGRTSSLLLALLSSLKGLNVLIIHFPALKR